MKIQLGNFKNKIKILQVTKSKDGTGSPVEVTSVLKTCWCQQIEVGGNEDDEGKMRILFDAAFIVKYDARLAKGKAGLMTVEDDTGVVYEFRKYLRINAVKDV